MTETVDETETKNDFSVCTYAAISTTPAITQSTKLVRFTPSEKNCEIELPLPLIAGKSLYVQYPVDRNYMVRVRTHQEKNYLTIMDKRQDEPTFEATSLEMSSSDRENSSFDACNRERHEFIPVFVHAQAGAMYRETRKTIALPKNEKIKQFSSSEEFSLSGECYEEKVKPK